MLPGSRRLTLIPHALAPPAGSQQRVEAALRKLHPCAVLTLGQLNGSFPSEVTFEPADSLQLHATMHAVVAALSQVSHLHLHANMQVVRVQGLGVESSRPGGLCSPGSQRAG